MDRLLRLNAGWVAGLGLVIAGLVRYRSFAARVILDRWSYGHFGLIALAVLVLLLVLVGSWQKSRARGVRSGRSRGRDLVQIAAATWGLAYFLASIDRASNGGNISEFVFFGSSMPLAAILEWISMTLLLAAVGFLAAPHLRGHGAKAALAIGSIALLALMAEGLLRVKVALAPATQGFPTFSGQVWERRYVHLNRDGFRDVDHQLLAPARVHRLLIVGDSYAFGWGIRHIEGRLGEKIVAKLTSVTGMPWEAINGSQCDTHTLDHIRFVEETLRYGPETVLLVYVFNDMDYLTPVTVRDRIFTKSRLGGLDPVRFLFRNSYLFQECYVRGRALRYRLFGSPSRDPYRDAAVVTRHVEDLRRFCDVASTGGARALVVPYDVAIVSDPTKRERYRTFVDRLIQARVPTISLERAFDGHSLASLTVNSLDGHPNERANQLAADAVCTALLGSHGG